MSDYAHPEVLVDTGWVRDHLGTQGVKIVEVDVDTSAYDLGHIPGALALNWQTQLQDQVRRDVIAPADFERLVGGLGIAPADTVVLYGDKSNWFAAYAFWIFKLYGHPDVRLMNGGRAKWVNEPDTKMVAEKPAPTPVDYRIQRINLDLRAHLRQVLHRRLANLIDVRSPDEYTGKIIAPPGMNETAQRGGHIPGARNVPWNMAVRPDGTFKSAEELRQLYLTEAAIDPKKMTIAYCRIGERSSHTWFVLKYLLGLRNVKNYDGSWTEYGNLVGMPIEK
ncbi:MAG TPA: sulfurtransferase [Planctomycetota bacterium]|jgi:thiosulfate/3-mercaptopyruvate sulfurtransferase